MAEGKWISDLKPETPLTEAARHVLFVRLRVVADCLPHATQHADDDIEHVHQLRVATRRADAALKLFAVCLPKKVYRKTHRCLRKLRRAAGAARDWDVFLVDLLDREAKEDAKHRAGLDFLTGYAVGQRAAAHGELESVYPEIGPDFEVLVAKAVESVRSPRGDSTPAVLVDLARPMLFERLRDLERAALGDLNDYAQLHQVRIAGKRLRYAMEVFVDCFDPTFGDTLYPRVEEMQDMLGRANDSHVAAERLTVLRGQVRGVCASAWPQLQAGIERVLRFHQRRLPQERRHFLKWWSEWHPAGSEGVMKSLLTPME